MLELPERLVFVLAHACLPSRTKPSTCSRALKESLELSRYRYRFCWDAAPPGGA